MKKYSDFLVYSDDFKGVIKYATGKTINGDGFERWNNSELVIYSTHKNLSEYHIKLENCLQKNDQIIFVDDLKDDIKREYLKQIKQEKK